MSTHQSHKSVKLNSLLNFITQAMASIFTFLSSIYLARVVGPYTVGQYSYLIWIISTFAALGSLGIPMAVTKYIAHYSEHKQKNIPKQIAGNWLLISTGLSVATALILCILAGLGILTANNKTVYFYLISLALPLNLTISLLSSIFSGNRRFMPLMRIGIVSSPLSFLILVIALYRSHSLTSILTAYLLGSLLTFSLYWISARKQNFISFTKLPRSIMMPTVKYALSVSGILLLDKVVWDRSEVLFLGHYSTTQQVAYYSLSYTFTTNIMTVLAGSVLGALMPHVSALHGKNDIQAITNSYQQASRFVSLLAGALVGGSISLAAPFILSFYGAKYADMIPVFRILSFTAGWATIGGVTAIIQYGTTKQGTILKIGLALSIINIMADFLVIPHYGATGAAMANGFSQFWGVIAGIYVLSRRGLPFPIRDFIKIGITAFVSCAITLFLVNRLATGNMLTFLVGGMIFIVIYSGLSFLSGVVRLSDLRMVLLARGKAASNAKL